MNRWLERVFALFINDLKALEGIEQVTLTTNGYLLEQASEKLKEAGIDAVNVSVDTVNRENFTKICRKDGLMEVLRGIDTAQELGIALKVNTVVSGNSAPAELLDVLDFSCKGITVRFHRADAHRYRGTDTGNKCGLIQLD